MWRRLEHAGEALRPRTRCTPQCDTKACATLLPMCHHFHDVSCKSGSKIDVRARVSGIMEHAYFGALARDEGCDYCAGRRQVARLAPDLAAIYCISLHARLYRQRAPARVARLHCANEPASADVALDRAVD